MTHAQDMLAALGLPPGDRHDLPTSEKRFPDGGALPHRDSQRRGAGGVCRGAGRGGAAASVPVQRISQGSGMMLLTDAELREMARLRRATSGSRCACLSDRARVGRHRTAADAGRQAVRLASPGHGPAGYALEDVLRGVEQGIRSILVADEGLLWLVGQAKTRGPAARRPGRQGVRGDGFDGQPGERPAAGAGRTDDGQRGVGHLAAAAGGAAPGGGPADRPVHRGAGRPGRVHALLRGPRARSGWARRSTSSSACATRRTSTPAACTCKPRQSRRAASVCAARAIALELPDPVRRGVSAHLSAARRGWACR